MKGGPSLVAVVLAAGSSRRFGGDKRRYLLDGAPMLQRTLAIPLSLELPTTLVLRPGDRQIEEDLVGPWRGDARLSIVYPECAEKGMGHSLAAAVTAAGNGDGVLVMLGDMPYIEAATIERLCNAFDGEGIFVPRYRGRNGHPVLFGRRWFGQLQNLTGDRGARSIIMDNPASVTSIEVEDPAVVRDIDHRPGSRGRES